MSLVGTTLSVAIAACVAAVASPCLGQSVLVPPLAPAPASPPSERPSDDLPFYNADGATLTAPTPAPPKHPFILAPSVNVGELVLPSLSSSGAWVEPMIEAGNDLWAVGLGYANLAGAHGVDLDASLGEWAFAVRLFDSNGWRGSWLLPDLHARFSFYPGQTRLPSWVVGGTTKIGGLRFAKCFGNVSLEMSAAAVFGPMIAKVDSIYGGVVIGGHLDIGVAFWR